MLVLLDVCKKLFLHISKNTGKCDKKNCCVCQNVREREREREQKDQPVHDQYENQSCMEVQGKSFKDGTHLILLVTAKTRREKPVHIQVGEMSLSFHFKVSISMSISNLLPREEYIKRNMSI